jgi:hypothetical protein
MEHVVREIIGENFPLYFPIFFVLMWLIVTTMLGFISGWYTLMKVYPDHSEEPLHTFARQSGSINFVGMRSILNLSVCTSGLRIGIMRIFGIFCRDFLVPWNAISVIRKDRVLRKVAQLSFGTPPIGNLTIRAEVADRIARAAGGLWPEPQSIPEETSAPTALRLIRQWAVATGLAASFFVIVPRLTMPKGTAVPPVIVAVLFPAVVFGTVGLIQYLRRQRP